jgi:hypothetical protein
MWSSVSPSTRQLLVVGGGGVLLGASLHAIFGPNEGPFDANLQAALVATSGVLITGALAYFAARIGASGAERASVISSSAAKAAADDDRKAAEVAALRALKVPLFDSVLEMAGTHHREVRNQFGWWGSMQGKPYTKAPDVGKTDPIWDASHKLFAFARQDTADLAEALYRELVALDEGFAFGAERDVVKRNVAHMAPGKADAFEIASDRVTQARSAFMKAIRSELGLRQLVDKPDGFRLPPDQRELD